MAHPQLVSLLMARLIKWMESAGPARRQKQRLCGASTEDGWSWVVYRHRLRKDMPMLIAQRSQGSDEWAEVLIYMIRERLYLLKTSQRARVHVYLSKDIFLQHVVYLCWFLCGWPWLTPPAWHPVTGILEELGRKLSARQRLHTATVMVLWQLTLVAIRIQ